MAKRPLPTPEQLRQVLRCDPETGKLYWRVRKPELCFHPGRSREKEAARWNRQFAGTEAGTLHTRGYISVNVLGVRTFAHRVVRAMFDDEWPVEVDHLNGIKDDNRPCNLRAVTHAENMRNVGRPRNNTSGRTGVTWSKARQKWVAQIKVGGRTRYLGIRRDFANAVALREAAEVQYGFTDRHGR